MSCLGLEAACDANVQRFLISKKKFKDKDSESRLEPRGAENENLWVADCNIRSQHTFEMVMNQCHSILGYLQLTYFIKKEYNSCFYGTE